MWGSINAANCIFQLAQLNSFHLPYSRSYVAIDYCYVDFQDALTLSYPPSRTHPGPWIGTYANTGDDIRKLRQLADPVDL